MGIEGGKSLRYYRESAPERIDPNGKGPRMRITAQSITEYLTRNGHSMSTGAWSEIENGITKKPNDLLEVIEILRNGLQLNDQQVEDIQQQFIWDAVAADYGEDFANRTIPVAVDLRIRRGQF